MNNAIPTVELKCLPQLPQEKLEEIHKGLVKAMTIFPKTGIKNEHDQLNLFQADLMEYGLGKEIKVVITDLPQSCKDIVNAIAFVVGDIIKSTFPESNVFCKAECCNPEAAYWSSLSEPVYNKLEREEKKWLPMHELCIRDLSGEEVFAHSLIHWARVYADGAAAPAKEIPILIETLKKAQVRIRNGVGFATVMPLVESAVQNLEQQLKESKQTK